VKTIFLNVDALRLAAGYRQVAKNAKKERRKEFYKLFRTALVILEGRFFSRFWF
jgi:hypothetical protein